MTPRQPILVQVHPAMYLVIEGQGPPATPSFEAAIGALYGVAFTIKMAKRAAGQDFAVPKLQGLWWGPHEDVSFLDEPPEAWYWKLMLRVPDFVSAGDLKATAARLRERKKPPEFERIELEGLEEKRCVQMLHIGPYAEEPASIERMKAFAREKGLVYHGPHHEIYLSDSHRVVPARLRTILRQPVRSAGQNQPS